MEYYSNYTRGEVAPIVEKMAQLILRSETSKYQVLMLNWPMLTDEPSYITQVNGLLTRLFPTQGKPDVTIQLKRLFSKHSSCSSIPLVVVVVLFP